MRGINARATLAMSIVVGSFDAITSEQLHKQANLMAYWDGRNDQACGVRETPFLFKDCPSLCEAWGQGFDLDDDLEMSEAASRAFTTEEGQGITKQINEAITSSMNGCGLSDVLYEKQVQAALGRILSAAPACLEKATKKLLTEHGYDPEFVPYQAQEGECHLTGIETDCCPCGRHP